MNGPQYYLKQFRTIRLTSLFVVIVFFMFVCLLAVAAEESGMTMNRFEVFLAHTYKVLTIPTYFLLGNYFGDIIFLVVILLSCALYALLIETIIDIVRVRMEGRN